MLKDIFKTKEIDSKAQLIAATIVAGYPPEKDTPSNEGEKAASNVNKELTIAISKGTAQTVDISKELNLGVYGKAKLCKHIQSNC